MSLIRDSLKKIQEKEDSADKTMALMATTKIAGGPRGSRTVYVLIGVGLLMIAGVYFLLFPAASQRPAQPKSAGEAKGLAGRSLPASGIRTAPATAGKASSLPEGQAETVKRTPPPASAGADGTVAVRPPTLATLPPSRAATVVKEEEKQSPPSQAGRSFWAGTEQVPPKGVAAPVPEVRKDKTAGPAGRKAAAKESASQASGRGIETDPQGQENLKKAYEQAYIWQQEGKIELAQARYREILAQDPYNPYVLTNLGLLYQKTGRLKEAVQAYEKAIEADPRMIPALQNLGVVWIRLGNSEEAGRWLERSLTLDPNNAGALANLGIIYNKKGNRELARQYWKRSLLRDPRLPEVCYNLARLEEETGNIPEAYQYYQQFIRLRNDPGDRLVQDVQRHIRDWKLPGVN
ncbi:MAG: tetratricopeptide repeat protein [Deltaproteobacteria bacterium]|nr:tetratricopeptide repeat protein [Deltaproteobacteria bacterium]